MVILEKNSLVMLGIGPLLYERPSDPEDWILLEKALAHLQSPPSFSVRLGLVSPFD
jgi:hypothetical protein